MVDTSAIRQHMDVIDSGGTKVGTVDGVQGERIKLTKSNSADGVHHYVPLSAVARIDGHVHLNATAAGLGLAAMAGAGAGAATAADGESGLPPVKNRAVDAATPRRNFYLPWIVGIVGLILLGLLLKSCLGDRDPVRSTATTAAPTTTAATAPLAVEAVSLPNGTTVQLAPGTLNYALQGYLAGREATPRTFTFDNLNFDTGSAAIRPADLPTVDALGQILAAYPAARGRIVGYTDARGADPANARLGQQRADAVVAALAAKGIDRTRFEAATGGEANPAGSNATAQGQFDNRRTELVVTAK